MSLLFLLPINIDFLNLSIHFSLVLRATSFVIKEKKLTTLILCRVQAHTRMHAGTTEWLKNWGFQYLIYCIWSFCSTFRTLISHLGLSQSWNVWFILLYFDHILAYKVSMKASFKNTLIISLGKRYAQASSFLSDKPNNF